MRENRLIDGKGDRAFRALNAALLAIVGLIALYPLYFSLIASVSDPLKTAVGEVTLYPKGFTLEAYKYVVENDIIWTGYRNSIVYMALGTLFDMLLTIPAAYALSRRELPAKKLFTWLFLFVMYFSGGMIPTYLIIKRLGLINTPMVMIVLGAVSIYNVIVSRTYFATSIPNELYEAAHVDGASELRVFARIALPLSLPILAVIALYYAVGHWNGFFNALLYLSDQALYPLQLILRNILLLNQRMSMGEFFDDDELLAAVERQQTAEAMKYALIFVSSAPMIICYVFTQKYFIRGLTAGAVKG